VTDVIFLHGLVICAVRISLFLLEYGDNMPIQKYTWKIIPSVILILMLSLVHYTSVGES